MKISNYSKEFTNEQIREFVKLLGYGYTPKRIIIYGSRINTIGYLLISPVFLAIEVLFGRIEGSYLVFFDIAHIFVFAQNDDGDNEQSKQLYSLHALAHELRHRYQHIKKIKCNNEKDADNFATLFINNNAQKIKDIMDWEDEWEVEEY